MNAGMTAEQKRAEGLRLMSLPEYQDPFHPDHEKVRKQVEDLYGTTGK